MAIGGMASAICRPDLKVKGLVGAAVFLTLYVVFMLGLEWFTPEYVSQVWNLAALSGVLVGGIPLEELLFGFSFGWYWTGVYEHFTRRTSVAHARKRGVASTAAGVRTGAHRRSPRSPTVTLV